MMTDSKPNAKGSGYCAGSLGSQQATWASIAHPNPVSSHRRKARPSRVVSVIEAYMI